MKRSLNPGLLILAGLLILFTQCQRELSSEGQPITVTADPITVVLQGNVVDENNLPVAGAIVEAGGKTTTTHAGGYFRIERAVLDKKTSLVTITKEGYFKGIRSFSATEGSNQVNIRLVPKSVAGSIPASSGGTVTLGNGSQVYLAPNSVVEESTGADYTGTVTVYAAFIDPQAEGIAETVPGSFTGIAGNGKRVLLDSYGMMAVQLEGGQGQKLQVRSGASATLTMPVTRLSAPSSIPLWYVDEKTGLWMEEGNATKQGSNYTCPVKHFSFWNCDYPFEAAILDLALHTSKGEPLVYTTVKITVETLGPDGGATAYGVTDSTGKVKGYVPANKNLALDVLDRCNNSIYHQIIGAISINSSLGIIKVPAGTPNIVTITGRLVNCTNDPVSNGYAIVSIDNMVRYAKVNNDGGFSLSFIDCNNTGAPAGIVAVDYKTNQQGVKNISLVKPLTATGDLLACGTSAEQYFRYNVDGIDYAFAFPFPDSVSVFSQPTGTEVIMSSGDYSRYVSFSFIANQAGTYPLTVFTIYGKGINGAVRMPSITTVISKYAVNFGEFYEGSLSGAYKDTSANGVQHNITATYKLRK